MKRVKRDRHEKKGRWTSKGDEEGEGEGGERGGEGT